MPPLLQNPILNVAVLSWFVAQSIKIIIKLVQAGKFDPSLFFAAGGMPSSHTSFAVAMATKVGTIEGFDSTFFAIASVFCLVVMYDAMGVRRQAGKHAEIINILITDWKNKPPLLKEVLGHKPLEVLFGLILGVSLGLLLA